MPIDLRLPRVTRILQAQGLVDYSMVGAGNLRQAQNRGTYVHRLCQENDIAGIDRDIVDDEMLRYVDAWNQFLADTGYEVYETEYPVQSLKWGYRGTLDRILKGMIYKKEALILVDLKATATMNPAVGPQTAAYKLAYQEMTKRIIKARLAVQLMPDGKYSMEPCKDQTDEYTFLSALQVYKWRKEHKLIKGD